MLVSLVLIVIGIAIVAKVTLVTMRHLRLDSVQVLEWLGLAEEPVDEYAARRVRVVRPVSAA